MTTPPTANLRPYWTPRSPADLPAPSPSIPSAPIPIPPEAILPSWADNDYDMVDSGTLVDWIRDSAQVGLFKYSAHCIQHPFDVATVLLRVRVASARDRRRFRMEDDPLAESAPEFEIEDDEFMDSPALSDDDDDEPAYFADQRVLNNDRTTRRKRPERKLTDRRGYVVNNALRVEDELPEHQVRIRDPNSILGALRAVWEKEGLKGVWKGNNCGFIYALFFSALQPLTQSLLGAVFALPDLDAINIADSDSPVLCLSVMAASFAITSVALAPLDIARIKLILSPIASKPRGLWPTLNTLPTGYTCPTNLLLPTSLFSIVEPIFDNGSLIFLKRRLNLDPEANQMSMSVLSTFVSVLRIFIEIPVETVLRRGQVEASKPERTIVTTGKYSGFFGTLWMIVKEEQAAGGKGTEGLFRGWRLEMWGRAFQFVSEMFTVTGSGEEF